MPHQFLAIVAAGGARGPSFGVGRGLTFRSKSVGCGYCSHLDRPSFRRSNPSQSLFIGPGFEREHHMRATGQSGVHIRSSSPRGIPGLRLEDIPPISMTFSTCGSFHGPRVHRTTSPLGGIWTPWIQQIPFLRSSGATRKGSNRLETASMRNARTSYRWILVQDGLMQRRQRIRGRSSSSRAVSNGACHHRRTSLWSGRWLIPGSRIRTMLELVTTRIEQDTSLP